MASSEIEFWRKNPPQAQVKSEQKTFVTFRPLPWYMTSCFEEKYPPEKNPSEKKTPEKKPTKKTTLSTNKVGTKNFRKVQAFALIHDQLLWRKKTHQKKNPPEKKPTRKKPTNFEEKNPHRAQIKSEKNFRNVQAFALIHDQLLLLPGWLIWYPLKKQIPCFLGRKLVFGALQKHYIEAILKKRPVANYQIKNRVFCFSNCDFLNGFLLLKSFWDFRNFLYDGFRWTFRF